MEGMTDAYFAFALPVAERQGYSESPADTWADASARSGSRKFK